MLACPLLGNGFVGLFLDQSGAIETRAAVVTIDSLRLVFVLTIRTNELGHGHGHEAESFFVLVSGVFAGAVAGPGFPSALAPAFSLLLFSPWEGDSFLAPSLYESLR